MTTISLTCPCCRQPVSRALGNARAVVDMMPLPPMQRRIMVILADQFGRFIDTSELVDRVYEAAPDGGPLTARRSVDVALSRLRPLLTYTPLAMETTSGGKGSFDKARRLIWREGAPT